MEKIIKFAVVGCGHIGQRHAEMINRNPQAELVGLVDVAPRQPGFNWPDAGRISKNPPALPLSSAGSA